LKTEIFSGAEVH